MGGAERVHADIVRAAGSPSATVFFTEKAHSRELLREYQRYARVEDISADTQSRARFYMRVGSMAAAINARPAPVVFGGHSDFFYRMLPHLAGHVRCIDILHNLGWRFEDLSLPCVDKLSARVLVSFQTQEQLVSLYRKQGLSDSLAARLRVIENCSDVPQSRPVRVPGPLRVLFVGRGDKVKRVHLVGRVATACRAQLAEATFTLVGDVENWLDAADRSNCILPGPISDPLKLRAIYAQSDLLLLTSSTEGFPLVVMEAMAQGCIPLCTNVGGLRFRIAHGETGLLFEPADETRLVREMSQAVLALAPDTARREALSAAAFATADRYFRRERFVAEYRELLLREMAALPAPQQAAVHG
jgi:glycosyltransferase involved in cell wall biosynthesis